MTKIWPILFIFFISLSAWGQDFIKFDSDLRLPVGAFIDIKIKDIHPTQAWVGEIEVGKRIKKVQKMSKKELEEYLREKVAPMVVGPGGEMYIVDHHHLAYLLDESEVSNSMYAEIKADWSHLSPEEFWVKMEENNWAYLFDDKGQKLSYLDLPDKISKLKDDPYRSLAWGLREKGGFVQTEPPTPFLEFRWANFLRDKVKEKDIQKDFSEAVEQALKISTNKEALKLPGHIDCNGHLR